MARVRGLLVATLLLLGAAAQARELMALPTCGVSGAGVTGKAYPYALQCRKNRTNQCTCPSGTCSVGSSANTYCSGPPPTCDASNMSQGNLYCVLNGQTVCSCPGSSTCTGGSRGNKYCQGVQPTCGLSNYDLGDNMDFGINTYTEIGSGYTPEECACECDGMSGCNGWLLDIDYCVVFTFTGDPDLRCSSYQVGIKKSVGANFPSGCTAP